jgi:hypothetical protein
LNFAGVTDPITRAAVTAGVTGRDPLQAGFGAAVGQFGSTLGNAVEGTLTGGGGSSTPSTPAPTLGGSMANGFDFSNPSSGFTFDQSWMGGDSTLPPSYDPGTFNFMPTPSVDTGQGPVDPNYNPDLGWLSAGTGGTDTSGFGSQIGSILGKIASGLFNPGSGQGGFGQAGQGGWAQMLQNLLQGAAGQYGSPMTGGNLFNLGSGIYGMQQANQASQTMQEYAAKADPFGPYRAQYATQLGQVMADPSAIFNVPGYQAGEQAVMRGMAKGGYTGSGNEMAALQKYGGDFYNQYIANLGQFAGAGIGPGVGAQIGAESALTKANLRGQGLNRAGMGAVPIANNIYSAFANA